MEKKTPLWKLVKPGQARFASADLLWEAAQAYFQWVDENPIKSNVSMTKARRSGKKREEENASATVNTALRPYTYSGLCAFCGIGKWADFKSRYTGKLGFDDVIVTVENIISTQQIEGAMSGAFRENLTARLNNLDIRDGDYLDATNNPDQKFNGFAFLPFTPGLINSETSKIASGETVDEEEQPIEDIEPERIEIIDENGRLRTENHQPQTEGSLQLS